MDRGLNCREVTGFRAAHTANDQQVSVLIHRQFGTGVKVVINLAAHDRACRIHFAVVEGLRAGLPEHM